MYDFSVKGQDFVFDQETMVLTSKDEYNRESIIGEVSEQYANAKQSLQKFLDGIDLDRLNEYYL